MTQARVKGFVVGYDEKGGGFVWVVKVKDTQSEFNGRKFEVHSTVGPTITHPATDVTFKIEHLPDGESTNLKAVDVRIFAQSQVEKKEKKKSSPPWQRDLRFVGHRKSG